MATEDLKPLNRTTGLGSGVNITDFHQSMNEFATSANTLGQMGSKMAQTASNTFSEQMGYEAGRNPTGNLFPALTESGKHYEAAYKSGAQASLGLKLSNLLSEGQIELAKLPKLTPEALQSFNENMPKGAQALFDQAPSDVRLSLEKSFGNSMTQINGSLNTKMINRQKDADHQSQVSLNNSEMIHIYDTALSGDVDGATDQLQMTLDNNERNLQTGVMSQQEHDASNAQALLSLHKGQYISLLNIAQSQGKEAEFLSDFSKNKPNELNYQQYEEVKSSLLKQLKNSNALEKGDQQATIAAFKLKEVWTQADVIDLKSKTTESQFYKAMYDYKVRSISRTKKEDSVRNAVSAWSQSKLYSGLSNKDKTAGLAAVTESIKKNMIDPESGAPLYSDEQAERAAVKSAGGPVPSYTDAIQTQLLSGSGADMISAAEAYNDISRNHPNNIPINTQARATMLAFADRLQKTGDPDVAAQESLQIISNKNPEQLELAARMVSDYHKVSFKDTASTVSFAKNLNGINIDELQSVNEYAFEARRRMNENLALTMNADQAKKLTQEDMNTLYGHSNVNGKKQLVKFPVERTVGMPETKSSAAIINSDIAAQMKAQFAETNRLYEEKDERGQRKSPFFFRITKEPDLNAALSASKNLQASDSENPDEHQYYIDLKKDLKTIDDFNNFKQIEMEQVYGDGHVVPHKLSVKAGLMMTKNNNASDPATHGYDVLSTQENGGTGPIHGSNVSTINGFKYNPNSDALGNVFFDINQHPELVDLSPQEKFAKLESNADLVDESSKAAAVSMVDPFTAYAIKQASQGVNQESTRSPDTSPELDTSAPKLEKKEREGREVDNSYLNTISKIESGSKGMNAVSKTGAIGKYQFMPKTWRDLVSKYGSETGITNKDITNLKSQEVMIKILTKENIQHLEKSLKRKPKDYEIYMSHVIGGGGAPRLIKEAARNPNGIVSKAGMGSNPRANPLFFASKNGSLNTYKQAVQKFEKAFNGAKNAGR